MPTLTHPFGLLLQSSPVSLWDVIRSIFDSSVSTGELIANAPNRIAISILIVLVAGFSETVGQSVVLFADRVRPSRFLLSLFFAAMLHVLGYIFWVFSVAAVAIFIFQREVDMALLAVGVAVSYIPLFLGFMGMMPYAGQRIVQLLYLLSLVILVDIVQILLQVSWLQAFLCAILGFILIQLVRATIGKPIVALGEWLLNLVAGTKLQMDFRR